MSDRRRATRHEVELTVELTHRGNMVMLKSYDLSQGGAFFDAAIPHAVGTRVKVRFVLPGDDRAVECDGEVVSARGEELGMGVKFIGLSSSDSRKVSRFAEAVTRAKD